MTIDEVLKLLIESIKKPETVEEAIEYIQQDQTCQVTIEDLAFKQVVVNTLIAAGIISEEDFNKSVNYFKGIITKNFAENLLKKLGHTDIKIDVKQMPEDVQDDQIDYDEEDDWNSLDKVGKA